MKFARSLEAVENCEDCLMQTDAFFCHQSHEAMSAFEKVKQTTLYPKGAILSIEGQNPRGIHMLCHGRVKLSVCASDGKTLILRIAEPGEVLGLSATVSNLPCEATAETIEPCQINFVKREDFLRLLSEHGETCFRVAQHLSQNYHTAYVQIRSLGLSHSAMEKLARLLLEWCADSGAGIGLEVRLKLGLTHEEIARMIGTSRETVSRLFSELKGRQTVYLKGSTLIVRDKSALEAIVNA